LRNYKLRNLNLPLTKYWLEYQNEKRHFGAAGVDGRLPLSVSQRTRIKNLILL